MRAILLLLFIVGCWNLSAQSNSQKLEITHGDTLSSIVNNNLRYAFEDFTEGVVMFKKGTVSHAKLNYDYLVGEIQFKDEKTGDVMALANPSDVSMVTIGNRKFIYKNGSEFIELLSDGAVYLGVYRRAKTISMGKTGAYGMVNTTSSIESLGNTGDTRYSLAVKEHIEVKTSSTYYLVTDKSKEMIKGVKTYIKVYPKDKASLIEKFVADNNIKFNKEEDLIKLTEYCDQL